MLKQRIGLTLLLVARLALSAPAQAATLTTWVHTSLAGNTTACGTTWRNDTMEAASNTHQCGERLTLHNPRNGATIVVTVTDYSPNSPLDLTAEAFSHLAPLEQGVIYVEVY